MRSIRCSLSLWTLPSPPAPLSQALFLSPLLFLLMVGPSCNAFYRAWKAYPTPALAARWGAELSRHPHDCCMIAARWGTELSRHPLSFSPCLSVTTINPFPSKPIRTNLITNPSEPIPSTNTSEPIPSPIHPNQSHHQYIRTNPITNPSEPIPSTKPNQQRQ